MLPQAEEGYLMHFQTELVVYKILSPLHFLDGFTPRNETKTRECPWSSVIWSWPGLCVDPELDNIIPCLTVCSLMNQNKINPWWMIILIQFKFFVVVEQWQHYCSLYTKFWWCDESFPQSSPLLLPYEQKNRSGSGSDKTRTDHHTSALIHQRIVIQHNWPWSLPLST